MAIKRLSPTAAARIAAGEVIDRPSAVVKELLENAIDAGARRIGVEVEGGGIELVRVVDDGHGIAGDELELAFERHATSKLSSDEDLTRVETLGFRGEALPSIAAAADVDVLTRTIGDSHAWRLALRGGRASAPEPATRAVGTTITVRELFADLPARRKFLRGRSSESGLIVVLVSQLALAYPEIAFALRVDGRRVVETTGDGSLLAAAAAVHGPRLGRALQPIVSPNSDNGVSVAGCLSVGDATLPTRSGITLLVNRRWVQHRGLAYAVDDAYRTVIPVGRHPVAVIDVRVSPAELDVNVHPRKSEVRLLHERAVFAAVQAAIRATLATAGAARSTTLLPINSDAADVPGDDWAALRVLGQAGGTYIIAEGAAGLYLVDQHAAHERVLLEALRRSLAGRRETQQLLQPEIVDLGAGAFEQVQERLDDVRSLGYEVEVFGDRALLVRAVPAVLGRRDPIETLRAALESLDDGPSRGDWRERLATLFACHSAVRAGDRLAPDEMAALLEQLGEAQLCQACSHGRPTAILLSHGQLAREFGRTY